MKNIILATVLVLVPNLVFAKSTRETTYKYNQIWNTAVRFLRVDNGFPITEKDRKSGYLMFTYTNGASAQLGSMELIEASRDRRRFVAVSLRVQNMPSYIEVLLLDKLERKLRDEYGDPPASAPISSSERAEEAEPGEPPSPGGANDDEEGSGAPNDAPEQN